MMMFSILLSLFFLSFVVVGCKSNSDYREKSIIGLEAGQDGRIRGAAAPIYLGLSDWFQKFKTAGAGEPDSIRTPKVSKSRDELPKAYLGGILAYIEQQEKRVLEMRQALGDRDQRRVEKILDQETREMMDIALVLIHPDYQPVTDDLLARYMASARLYGNFSDVFAAQGYLDILLKFWSIPELAKDAERQRVVYLEELKKQYLNEGSQNALLSVLDKAESSLMAMKDELQNKGPGLSLAGESGLTVKQPVQGPVAILASFLGPLQAALGGTNGAARDRTIISKNEEFQNTQGPSSSSPASVAASRSEPSSTSGVGAQPAQQGLNFSKFPGRSFVEGGVLRVADEHDSERGLHPGDNFVITPTQPSQSFSLPEVKAPPLDCLKFGLNGEALIQCHRFAGFLNLKKPNNSGTSLTTDGDRQEPQLALADSGKNTALLQYKVLAGAAEVGEGHIFQQGSIGSCSLQAAVGAAYISLARLGVDPKKALPRDGRAINTVFQTTQRSEPTPDAALKVLTKLLPNYQVRSVPMPNVQSIRQSIDAGYALFVGVNVDIRSWTNNGASGGREFFLTDGLGLTGNPRTLRCNTSPEWFGHAVTVVGYDGNDLLIKNSWGATWGDGGIARIDSRSCFAGTSFAYSIQVNKK